MAKVPRWPLPMWMRITWTLILLALAFVTTVARGLDEFLKPKTMPWIHEPKLQLALLFALGFMTLIDAGKRSWVRLKMESKTKQRIRIRNQLAAVLASLEESLDQPIRDFGCGLFLVQNRGIRRPQRLVRRERVRLIDDVAESDVQYFNGKATVGQCWKLQRVQHHDWRTINQRYASANDMSDEDYAKVSEAAKRGLSKAEFLSLVGKYAEVLAVPITEDGKFIGCIAVDRKWDPEAPEPSTVLDSKVAKKVVGAAARTLVPAL